MWFEADKIGFNNQENHYRLFWKDEVDWVYVPQDNQIYYISNDGQVFNPNIVGNPGNGFGANIVSNTYNDGVGIITFDGPVTRIGTYTFLASGHNNAITDIFIPESVTTLHKGAYYESGLRFAHITKNIDTIDSFCYDRTNVDYVSVDPSNSYFSVVNNSIVNTSGHLIIGSNKSYIDSNITLIGPAAFSGRRNITSIDIPQGQQKIYNYTFSWCYGLSNVNIPSSVTEIGSSAFEVCINLNNIDIPSSVTSIDVGAFLSCLSLVDIKVDAVVPPSIPAPDPDYGGIFGLVGSVSGRRIRVPAGSVSAYRNDSGWSYYASEIVSQ